MLKKAWDGIKQIVTLKTKDKTTPNLLMHDLRTTRFYPKNFGN